jgi:hypothetical protein
VRTRVAETTRVGAPGLPNADGSSRPSRTPHSGLPERVDLGLRQPGGLHALPERSRDRRHHPGEGEEEPGHVGRARGHGDAAPKGFEEALGFGRSAGAQPLGEHGCVHRPGAGAADRRDAEVGLVEQTVEHAPGEGAERAAALEDERHRHRPAVPGRRATAARFGAAGAVRLGPDDVHRRWPPARAMDGAGAAMSTAVPTRSEAPAMGHTPRGSRAAAAAKRARRTTGAVSKRL